MALFTTKTPIEKELAALERKQQRLDRDASRASPPRWKEELEARIPKKTLDGLESAFGKGFSLIFEKGTAVISKACRVKTLTQDYTVADFAARVKGRRKDIRSVSKAARNSNLGNLALTTAEGIGLGALGVGMPDIVLFLSMVLKGIYETALSYGFSYDTLPEQLLILKMVEASLSRGEDYLECNQEVELLLSYESVCTAEEIQQQISQTSRCLASDMLLLKFIQGLPVVGILGGAGNPVYYNRILRYAELKYRKRYLLALQRQQEKGGK